MEYFSRDFSSAFVTANPSDLLEFLITYLSLNVLK